MVADWTKGQCSLWSKLDQGRLPVRSRSINRMFANSTAVQQLHCMQLPVEIIPLAFDGEPMNQSCSEDASYARCCGVRVSLQTPTAACSPMPLQHSRPQHG